MFQCYLHHIFQINVFQNGFQRRENEIHWFRMYDSGFVSRTVCVSWNSSGVGWCPTFSFIMLPPVRISLVTITRYLPSTLDIYLLIQLVFFIVIVEQKLKLERSLEKEKREHIKTKEDLNELIQDEKQLRDKQNVDYMIRYNELEHNHEVLQVKFMLWYFRKLDQCF